MKVGVANLREESVRGNSGRTVMFALVLIFVLAAAFVSAGLVVYTAWHHDLKNGLFALAFAVLSARAVLSWIIWRNSDGVLNSAGHQDRGGRKPADEPLR
jgi:hypothetical protein